MEDQELDLNGTLRWAMAVVASRRWIVFLTAPVVALGALAVVSRIPNTYTSEATLLVVEQQVPQRYVVPTAATDMREALEATTQEVLSRTRLLAVIDEFGLYPRKKKKLSPEGLLELMRQDINIKPMETESPGKKELTAFKISFVAENPHLAQDVASRLTSLFIEENLKTRERQSATTTNFLEEQLDAAKKKLADQEDRVRNFKMENLGELPEQQQGNLAILGGLQVQLQNAMAGLNRAQQQQVYLQSLLSGYRGLAAQARPPAAVSNTGAGTALPISSGPIKASLIETEEGELIRLQAERVTLLNRYTPQHPDLIAINEKIAETQAVLKTLRAERSVAIEKARAQAPAAPGRPEEDVDTTDPQIKSQIEQAKSQLEANRLEIANLTKEQNQLKDTIAQYQSRLNQTPVREQQLAGILRDYDLLKQDYTDLLGKRMQSQLAANLEKRQEGQQFRLVDRPSLPTEPTAPKRMQFSLGGVAGGLILGLVLAFLAELRNPSFHSEKELTRHFPLPLIVSVPLILTPAEKRSLGWKRVLEWTAVSALAVTVIAAEVYSYYQFRHG